jgi:hypothetical protein
LVEHRIPDPKAMSSSLITFNTPLFGAQRLFSL